MMKALRILSIIIGATALQSAAPKPKLVREINLNATVHESEGLQPSTHSVQALVFSPDEKWVAAGVGIHRKPGPNQPGEWGVSHLMVVPVNGSAGQDLQIDSDVRVTELGLFWAPDSSTVLVDAKPPKWYSIPGGALWKQGEPDPRLDMVLGFVDAQHAVAYASQEERLRAKREGAPIILYIFDLTGRIVDEWRAPPRWWFAAVNSDRHLLAVSKDIRQAEPICPIFSYPSKTVVQEWSQDHPAGVPNFAEAGKTVCEFGGYGRGVPFPACWDIDTGKKIAEFKRFRGGGPASVSSHGTRIILTHIRNYRGITQEFDMHSYHDRIVWDFRTGKEIAEWVPMTQVTETGLRAPEDKRTEFGPSVISPSGRYIAEGSNGIIRIYELP
jgi:hypothetical protein